MPTQLALRFTVKALLERYVFWRHEEFRIAWPIPAGAEGIRLEIVKLRQAGQRMTDARGFVKIGRWRIYVEEGLPRT